MYIEDLINEFMFGQVKPNRFDSKIIDSFTNQIMNGTGFTEKQSVLAVKIITRYAERLSTELKKDIRPFLENPQFRFKIRKTVTDRSIKIIDNKIIEARFPYDEYFITEIKKYRTSDPTNNIIWDKDNTSWNFQLREDNIQFLSNLCSDIDFDYDDQFKHYANQTADIIQNMEKYAPILTSVDGTLKIVNSPKNMPEITATDVVGAVCQARQYGVSLYSDDIDRYLNSDQIDAKIKQFLTSDNGNPIKLSNSENDVKCLEIILKNMGPTLFIVPGGSELEKLERAFGILKGIGVAEKNMSVLFRLPTESGKNFNDFVKKMGINGPIDTETKVVFISGKLPKPLVKSGIRFNSIINLGFDSAHYTLKSFVKNHQNLVYFDVNKNQKGLNFGNL